MSLDQLHRLAHAAGFGAVSEDEIDLERLAEFDPATRRVSRHVPDAPAPRDGQSRAIAVVEPLWRSPRATVTWWTMPVPSMPRSLSGLLGRGLPA